tara:strand:+ start:1929 stop:2150 length:222 start_codon:yes stop_codon:yes gene_type:complete
MTYLTYAQVEEMAETALSSYEMAGSWGPATQAALEYSLDEFGIKPSKSVVRLSVKLAKLKWHAISIGVKNLQA